MTCTQVHEISNQLLARQNQQKMIDKQLKNIQVPNVVTFILLSKFTLIFCFCRAGFLRHILNAYFGYQKCFLCPRCGLDIALAMRIIRKHVIRVRHFFLSTLAQNNATNIDMCQSALDSVRFHCEKYVLSQHLRRRYTRASSQ